MYAPTALFFYKAIFTVELIIAEFICAYGLRKRKLFWLRLFGSAIFCVGVAFAIPIPVTMYNALYSSFVFLSLFVVSLLAMWFCYDEKFISVLFRAIAGYTTQHVAYQIYDLAALGVSAAFSGNAGANGAYGSGVVGESTSIFASILRNPEKFAVGTAQFEYACLFTVFAYVIIYPAVYYLGNLFVEKRMKDGDKFELKPSLAFAFIVLFVLSNIIMSACTTYYSSDKFDTFYVVQLDVYNIAAAVFTLYFMIEVIYRKQLERDYAAADRRLQQSGEQYKLSKRNVELINMKCHDLKHQIHSVVGGTIDRNTLDEIDKVISIYDAEMLTGNAALDTILTEKSLYCIKHDIKLYCIVDGKLLSFISDADLYSLFGNILDNAIEAVRPLVKKHRFIDLSVAEVNGFVRIKASNRYDGELQFESGLPKSTKGNDEIHGYGMKSIRHVCQKYGAEMNVLADNGKFEIAIVFYGTADRGKKTVDVKA